MFRQTLRRALHFTIGLVIAAVVIRTWLVMGLIVPVVVSGSSMAPTLLGPHRLFTCRECGHTFSVGLDQLPRGDKAWCPNCDQRRARSLEIKVSHSGQSLRIDRTAFMLRRPRRWEVVVFRCPDRADQLCVKRIVALPGETVTLAAGDVLVDGQIVRKSLAEQRAVRQLVFNGDGTKLDYQPPGGGPITDESSYNQGAVPPPHRVRDLMLTYAARPSGEGQLTLAIENADGRFVATIDFGERRATLRRDGELLDEAPLLPQETAGGVLVELTLSLFDRQALLAADDRVLIAVPIRTGHFRDQSARDEPAGEQRLVARPPLSVNVGGLEGEVCSLSVWRDVYYGVRPGDRPQRTGPPDDPNRAATWQLGPAEYFVVGDNAAISDDSRSWVPKGGLNAKLIIGKPLGVR